MRNDPLGSFAQLAEMDYNHVEYVNYVNDIFYVCVLAQYPGRYENIHVKDIIKREDGRNAKLPEYFNVFIQLY